MSFCQFEIEKLKDKLLVNKVIMWNIIYGAHNFKVIYFAMAHYFKVNAVA